MCRNNERLHCRGGRWAEAGTAGEVHMSLFLANPKIDGTIFAALREPATFSQARIVLGAVQWPNGADLVPDAMYDAIRQRGLWVLD
jgi:hypothetical protein